MRPNPLAFLFFGFVLHPFRQTICLRTQQCLELVSIYFFVHFFNNFRKIVDLQRIFLTIGMVVCLSFLLSFFPMLCKCCKVEKKIIIRFYGNEHFVDGFATYLCRFEVTCVRFFPQIIFSFYFIRCNERRDSSFFQW